MFMCVVKLTFTHTVAFFDSDQNNKKILVKSRQINFSKKNFFLSIFDNKHLRIKMLVSENGKYPKEITPKIKKEI